jgi:hypothetical protein
MRSASAIAARSAIGLVASDDTLCTAIPAADSSAASAARRSGLRPVRTTGPTCAAELLRGGLADAGSGTDGAQLLTVSSTLDTFRQKW